MSQCTQFDSGAMAHIGYLIKSVSKQIHCQIDTALAEVDEHRLTSMQGRFIGYLYVHRDDMVFGRDFEKEFQIRRSTASGILRLLEEGGYIAKKAVNDDARLKQIVLTDKALARQKVVLRAIEGVEAQLVTGIPEEELDAFIQTLTKMKGNLEDIC